MKEIFFVTGFLTIFLSCKNEGAKLSNEKQVETVSEVVIRPSLSPDSFVNVLKSQGYFNYTEPKHINKVRDTILNHLRGDKQFTPAINPKPPYNSFDYRFYSCGDGEELFEKDGVLDMIKEMQPLFAKLNVRITPSNDRYIGDYHSIDINGRNYLISQGTWLMWGEAILNYAKMLNQEFAHQNVKERVYIMDWDDSVYLVVLTDSLQDLIARHFRADGYPLSPDHWEASVKAKMQDVLR